MPSDDDHFPTSLTRSYSFSSEISGNQGFNANDNDVSPSAPPPNYNSIAHKEPSIDPPEIPAPPSYDEVMANANRYTE